MWKPWPVFSRKISGFRSYSVKTWFHNSVFLLFPKYGRSEFQFWLLFWFIVNNDHKIEQKTFKVLHLIIFAETPKWTIIAITLSPLQPYSTTPSPPLRKLNSMPLKHSCFLCSCSPAVGKRGFSLPQTAHVEPAKSASRLITVAVELHLGFIDCFMQEGQVPGYSQPRVGKMTAWRKYSCFWIQYFLLDWLWHLYFS